MASYPSGVLSLLGTSVWSAQQDRVGHAVLLAQPVPNSLNPTRKEGWVVGAITLTASEILPLVLLLLHVLNEDMHLRTSSASCGYCPVLLLR